MSLSPQRHLMATVFAIIAADVIGVVKFVVELFTGRWAEAAVAGGTVVLLCIAFLLLVNSPSFGAPDENDPHGSDD